jgi:hypothetical protein
VRPSAAPKSKKKKSAAQLQEDLRALQSSGSKEVPKVDLKKGFVRVAAVLAILWVIALFIPSPIPKYVMAALTVVAAGAGVWFVRYVKKTEALGSLLRGADTAEGRKEALDKLDADFKKGDVQATLARAQLEMQEDPRKALETLETVNLDKQLTPVGDQVRALRAMLHLTLGEPAEARPLVDKLELGKQQDVKTRAMFATVAGEAWARTGLAKKGLETLELFNPEDPEISDMRIQMWRARAFAYASLNDLKGVQRCLRKLCDSSPQLLAMFVQQKKVHPLLEREAKQILMQSGAVPRKMTRQRL